MDVGSCRLPNWAWQEKVCKERGVCAFDSCGLMRLQVYLVRFQFGLVVNLPLVERDY